MNFGLMKKAMIEKFDNMIQDKNRLFEVEMDRDELFDVYINNFPKGTNEIYRKRTTHDCSCCKNFIRNFGNVVTLTDGVIDTIWNFKNDEYQPVLDAMHNHVMSKNIVNVHVAKQARVGVDSNFENMEDGPKKWEHFSVLLPKRFVDTSSDSIGSIQGEVRTSKEVFKRALTEITIDSINIVRELIATNSLYKGDEYGYQVNRFTEHKKAFDKLDDEAKELYAWSVSILVGPVLARIRNSSIGTLLTDISEGVELDVAVAKYDDKVAPENYKRSKPIYTKQMLDAARHKVEVLGLTDSLGRRFATVDDITANNILFMNRDVTKVKSASVFDEMSKDININPKNYSKVQDITINDFINNVLPTAQNIEVLVENRHSNNLMSLIAPKIPGCKNMFKWDNNYSWAYNNNLADASMRERVKKAGGKIDGKLRFSIQWNDLEVFNGNDLDAHCIEANNNEIYFARRHGYTGGILDVDIQHPVAGEPSVENITWADLDRMQDGEYKFFVRNYAHRGGRDGFAAEIEFDGQIHEFEYRKDIAENEAVHVATVKYSKATGLTIVNVLNSNLVSRKLWNVPTNQFTPVSAIMHSPNYWNEQVGVGNKHFFFMLDGCVNLQNPNGFFNEYLDNELIEHRKVFEALGSKMCVEDNENQLSGLGFSVTQRAEVVVRVTGNTKRVLRIKL